jgi:RHS repeat-associated protein
VENTLGAGGAPIMLSSIAFEPNAEGGWSLLQHGETYPSWEVEGAGVRTVYHGQIVSGQTVVTATERYEQFPWGEELTRTTTYDPGAPGPNDFPTVYAYYDDDAEDSDEDGHVDAAWEYGRLKAVIDPRGHWVGYTYDEEGRVASKVTQFLNAELDLEAHPPWAVADCRVTVYEYTADGGDDGTRAPRSARTITEYLKGVVAAREHRRFLANKTIVERCVSGTAAFGDAANLRTETEFYTIGYPGRLKKVTHPDETTSTYAYSDVTVSGIDAERVQVTRGNAQGTEGTRTITVTANAGFVLSRRQEDVASDLTLNSEVHSGFNAFGEPGNVTYLDGSIREMSYDCCGLASETDRDGTTTVYVHVDGRLHSQTRDGIETRYGYDPFGNLIRETRVGTDQSEIVVRRAGFDAQGNLQAETNALDAVTAYGFSIVPGVSYTHVVTNADLSVAETEYYPDGSVRRIGGTSTPHREYEYGVDGEGVYTLEYPASNPDEWVKRYVDLLGRPSKTVFPGIDAGADAFETVFYNDRGQRTKTVDIAGATTFYRYNDRGEVTNTVWDVNGNGLIDSGIDRMTWVTSSVYWDAGRNEDVRRTITQVFPNASDPTTTETVREVIASTDGLQEWVLEAGIEGPLHRETIRLDNGLRQEVVTAPDGSTVTERFQDGRLVERARTNAANQRVFLETYGYDPHGRLETATDIRTGATTYEYDDADQVILVTTPVPGPGQAAQVTESYYDPMGRVTNTVTAAGAVVQLYDVMGQLTNTYGAMTYPVAYGYDPQGRLQTLRTWQNHAGRTGEAVTTWTYHADRGWLSGKTYHGAAGPTYVYTNGGRLERRSWARNLDTDYEYTYVGELSTIAYGDATPPVTHGYDRRGRVETTTDGMGTREFGYHPSGQTEREEFQSGALAGYTLHRGFDDFGRHDQLRIASPSNPNLYVVTYGYDSASRLRTVTAGDDSATYAYVPDSALIASVAFTNAGVERMAITRQYDLLDRVTDVVSTAAGAAVFARFAYGYNAAGLRERIELADGTYWDYGYDSLGQVTSGVRRVTGEPEPWLSFDYGFDDIGNRQYATSHGATSTYQANLLNQYTQRTVPGVAALIGSVNPDANLTVDNQPAARVGDYFLGLVPFDNSAQSVYTTSTVVGVVNDPRLPTVEDAVMTVERNVRLPKALQEFVHDDDGNLETDTQWDYGWDAENRLRWMQTAVAEQNPHVPWRRIDYAYDAQGRRCRKTVTDAAETVLSDTLYLYDHWNLLAELDAADGNALIRTYVWGLDLSGTPQGAGGVGGLLYVTDHRAAKDLFRRHGRQRQCRRTRRHFGRRRRGHLPVRPVREPAGGGHPPRRIRRRQPALRHRRTGQRDRHRLHPFLGRKRPPALRRATAHSPERRPLHRRPAPERPVGLRHEPDIRPLHPAPYRHPRRRMRLHRQYRHPPRRNPRRIPRHRPRLPQRRPRHHPGILRRPAEPGRIRTRRRHRLHRPRTQTRQPVPVLHQVHGGETGLVYYGMRYYSPELGRWLSRDPIEEGGTPNLYCALDNSPPNAWDAVGLWVQLSAAPSSAGYAILIVGYRGGNKKVTAATRGGIYNAIAPIASRPNKVDVYFANASENLRGKMKTELKKYRTNKCPTIYVVFVGHSRGGARAIKDTEWMNRQLHKVARSGITGEIYLYTLDAYKIIGGVVRDGPDADLLQQFVNYYQRTVGGGPHGAPISGAANLDFTGVKHTDLDEDRAPQIARRIEEIVQRAESSVGAGR